MSNSETLQYNNAIVMTDYYCDHHWRHRHQSQTMIKNSFHLRSVDYVF